jgi:hypothetical protein
MYRGVRLRTPGMTHFSALNALMKRPEGLHYIS